MSECRTPAVGVTSGAEILAKKADVTQSGSRIDRCDQARHMNVTVVGFVNFLESRWKGFTSLRDGNVLTAPRFWRSNMQIDAQVVADRLRGEDLNFLPWICHEIPHPPTSDFLCSFHQRIDARDFASARLRRRVGRKRGSRQHRRDSRSDVAGLRRPGNDSRTVEEVPDIHDLHRHNDDFVHCANNHARDHHHSEFCERSVD